jgi:hypothetical protein
MGNRYRFGEIVTSLSLFGSLRRQRSASGRHQLSAIHREKPEIILLPITSQLKHRDTYGTVTIVD